MIIVNNNTNGKVIVNWHIPNSSYERKNEERGSERGRERISLDGRRRIGNNNDDENENVVTRDFEGKIICSVVFLFAIY